MIWNNTTEVGFCRASCDGYHYLVAHYRLPNHISSIVDNVFGLSLVKFDLKIVDDFIVVEKISSDESVPVFCQLIAHVMYLSYLNTPGNVFDLSSQIYDIHNFSLVIQLNYNCLEILIANSFTKY